jgi:hypothetical protein
MLKAVSTGEKQKLDKKDGSPYFSPDMFLHQRDFLIDSD